MMETEEEKIVRYEADFLLALLVYTGASWAGILMLGVPVAMALQWIFQ